jgi:hypothetical protein
MGWVRPEQVAAAMQEAGQQGQRTGQHAPQLMALLFGLNVMVVDEGGREIDMRPWGQPTQAGPQGRLLRPERRSGWLVRAARPAGHFLTEHLPDHLSHLEAGQIVHRRDDRSLLLRYGGAP